MELTKIEIQNYKSIKSPVTISFSKNLPTVLIGKNGSGKTNVLEALSAIAMANGTSMPVREEKEISYCAYIQLSKEDMKAILPDKGYDKTQCEIVAYSGNDGLKISRIRSEYIVPLLKKEVGDIRDLAEQLKEALDEYEEQLIKISHDGDDDLPFCCYKFENENGGLTNYNYLHYQTEKFLENLHQCLDSLLKAFKDDEYTFVFTTGIPYYFGKDFEHTFCLKYVEPQLAAFERDFIKIDQTAIKNEIEKINKATKESCDRIDKLIDEINDRFQRFQKEICEKEWFSDESKDKYYCFLQEVQHVIGNRCLFLKNESRDVIFQTERNYYENDHSSSIIETYLRQVYRGSDREELLRQHSQKVSLSEQAIADFEKYLNENIPEFDKNMYESISVESGHDNQVSIYLNEKSGERVHLNNTSAGRRWYFTYYFMKSILISGDMFIIDEPAAMLHPSAQKEVLGDLMELSKKGIKVVFTTHSPYLIPKNWNCVHFVAMTDSGTEVSNIFSDSERKDKMKEIVGEDIFDIQCILEEYSSSPEIVAKNISEIIRKKAKEKGINLHEACDEMGIQYETMASWNKNPCKNGGKNTKYNTPCLENVLTVLAWSEKNFSDILKK